MSCKKIYLKKCDYCKYNNNIKKLNYSYSNIIIICLIISIFIYFIKVMIITIQFKTKMYQTILCINNKNIINNKN